MIMRKVKSRVLSFISSGLFLIAIQSVNLVSKKHLYEEKEPDSLKKYEKY